MMQLGELIWTVLIGEKWKIEIQKHHYRLCFHIRALLILLPLLLPRCSWEKENFTGFGMFFLDRSSPQLEIRKMVKITKVRKNALWLNQIVHIKQTNCRTKQLVWNSLNSERVSSRVSSYTSPLVFITDLDLNVSIHLANVKNLPSSRAGLMLSHKQSRHSSITPQEDCG